MCKSEWAVGCASAKRKIKEQTQKQGKINRKNDRQINCVLWLSDSSAHWPKQWMRFDHYSSTNEASIRVTKNALPKVTRGVSGRELTQHCLKIKRTRTELSSTRISLFHQMFWQLSSPSMRIYLKRNCLKDALTDSCRTITEVIINWFGKSAQRVFRAVHSQLKLQHIHLLAFLTRIIAYLKIFEA